MKKPNQVLILIAVMIVIAILIGVIVFTFLYKTAIQEESARLVETAKSQARLIEAIARHTALDYPNDRNEVEAITLAQIRDAHAQYEGFGRTGEFTLAKREGNQMVFLLNHRHGDLGNPQPIPFDSNLAEPMRRSISGLSGTVIGLDYRGEMVLAAYEPVAELNLGIVAKIDRSEIQAPFIQAAMYAGSVAIVLVFLGAFVVTRVTAPMIASIQESEAKYRNLVEFAPLNISIIQDMLVRYTSHYCMIIHGYTEDEVYTMSAQDRMNIVHSEDRDRIRLYYEKGLNGETAPSNYELRIVHKDGSQRWIERWVVMTTLNSRPAVMTIDSDITKRKHAEQALKDYSERLEEMVQERTAELQATQEKMLRQERLAVLGQLSGGVGHELRNPLGVITNSIYYIKLLQPGADQEITESLDLIEENTKIATRIVGDLLDFARVKPVIRAAVAVSDLVEPVLSQNPPPENITIYLELPTDIPPVQVDAQQIKQVLTNLITNAYQAMSLPVSSSRPEGGKVTVVAKLKQDMIEISISDTGSGIKPENKGNIFEPLFTTKARGIGLGLAISQDLININDGSITFESEIGKGTTFTVRLPIYRDAL